MIIPENRKISVIIPTPTCAENINLLTQTIIRLVEHRDYKYLYEFIVSPNNWTGFSKPVNAGIKVAKGEYILIMNDDVEVLNFGWEDIMMNVFKRDDNVGIVGVRESRHYSKYSALWFTLIKKEVFDKIGLLDEDLNYFMQDIDFGYRARKAGFRTEFVRLNIKHGLSQTTSRLDNEEELKREAKEIFEKKWGIGVDDL